MGCPGGAPKETNAMRKILALALVLGLAVLVGGVAGAAGDGSGTGGAASGPIGVRYDWIGGVGEVSIIGSPGMLFQAYDSFGQPVAEGVLPDSYFSAPAGNSGVGPDGVVLYVVVGGGIVAVTDPDWEWN
jgi:hypothetical protein